MGSIKKILGLAAGALVAYVTPSKADDYAAAVALILTAKDLLHSHNAQKSSDASKLNQSASDLLEQARQANRSAADAADLVQKVASIVPAES